MNTKPHDSRVYLYPNSAVSFKYICSLCRNICKRLRSFSSTKISCCKHWVILLGFSFQINRQVAILEGFRIIVDHPHPHIVRFCENEFARLNPSSKSHHKILNILIIYFVTVRNQVAHVSWFLATNSLHLTTFCLQYPPTIIAALCIYLSCKYIRCSLPANTDQPWWAEIDPNANEELLTRLAYEYVAILDKSPTRYKEYKGSKLGKHGNLLSNCWNMVKFSGDSTIIAT